MKYYLILSLLFADIFFIGMAIAGDNKTREKIHLSGPEIYKLDWNTRSFSAADMDNNSAKDIILLNNDQTKIEILYQNRPDIYTRKLQSQKSWQPVLEDARFVKKGLVTGFNMNALAIADINADQRMDLIVSSKLHGLTVYFQKEKDQWHPARHFDFLQAATDKESLKVADIDQDGDSDIILLGKKILYILYQDGNKHFTIKQYPLSGNNYFGLKLMDVNKDQRLDIIYFARNSRYSLRVNLQNSDTGFGAERMFAMQTPNEQISFYKQKGNNNVSLAYVQKKMNLINIGHFSTAAQQTKDTIIPLPHVYPLPMEGVKSANYAIGDLDGDDLLDIVIGDYKGAQVWFYQQQNNGQFSNPVAYPSFSGVEALTIADLDNDGHNELYVASKKEKLLGVSRFINNRKIAYPEPMDVAGQPIVLTAVPLGSNKTMSLLNIYKNNKKRMLRVIQYDPIAADWRTSQNIELSNLKLDPSGIKSVDINHDGLQDLLVFIMHKPAMVLLQTADARFELISDKSFSKGLLDNIKPGDMTVGALSDANTEQLFIAGKGFARAIGLSEKQHLKVLDQYNAVNKTRRVASILPVNIDQDKAKELLVYQAQSDRLDLYKQDETLVFRALNSYQVGKIDLLDSYIFPGTNKQKPRIIYLGSDRFWIIPIGENDISFKPGAQFETSLDDVSFDFVTTGELIQNQTDEIIAVDSSYSHMVEILHYDGKQWRSLLNFKLFDSLSLDDEEGSMSAPREILVEDFTGDQRADLLFVVHDRLLLYTR